MSAEPTGPAVVAFGAGDAVADRDVPARLRRVAGDWRVSLAILVLAGVAGFASLVAPWSTVAVRPDQTAPADQVGSPFEQGMPFRIMDIGAFGTAHLLGMFALALAAMLALFGPAGARRAARLGGLTLAGAMVASLVAFAMSFDDSMQRNFFYGTAEQERATIENGAGLTTAFLATILAGLALFLVRWTTTVAEPAYANGADPDWAWRPPRPVHDETAEEIAAAAPLDLTVQPARPFAHPDPDEGRAR